MTRFFVWSGIEEWHAEAASVEAGEDGLRATGVQLGADALPYRLDYRLEAPGNFVTTRLELNAVGEGWRRRLLLRHDGSGTWEADASGEGPDPGGGSASGDQLPDLSDALDCDIANSPLTNTMPVRRHGLDREGTHDFLMAWVSVPDLRVHASRQRYEHVRRDGAGSVVRYVSLDSDFTAELELDGDGLVIDYPQLARRVGPAPGNTAFRG